MAEGSMVPPGDDTNISFRSTLYTSQYFLNKTTTSTNKTSNYTTFLLILPLFSTKKALTHNACFFILTTEPNKKLHERKTQMKGPKVAVIGAGSYFFGKPAIWNMINSEILRNGTLALVDTNPKTLETMMSLGRKAIETTKAPTQLIGSVDRKEVLKDADFVVLTFSFRNAYYRGVDTKISKKYGVTMCSSDTIGPGGIFRALREIPEALAVAKDMETLCPNAWLINFINPTSVMGIALMRHAKVKSFALCDGNHEPNNTLHRLKYVGILPEDAETAPMEMLAKTDIKIGGVNHCTWMTKFTYDGEDMLPRYRARVAEQAAVEEPNPKAKPRFNHKYSLALMDLYGAFPTAASHTKEYVPFFQGYGVTQNSPEPIIPFNAETRATEMEEAWLKTQKLANGETPISEFIENGRGDHATDIIESMWGGLNKQFYINQPNRGAITNMPDDAFLELKCHASMNGLTPLPFGEMPRGLLGLQHQVLDTHELTAEAAVTCDKKILMKAMMTDPIINNIGDGEKIMEELLEAEREHLAEGWYK
jgi:alpha-galactosidase